ncbi:MAG TPA: site-specific DNA-methyltransferase [Candidatus Paceibacterota bacterium]|nr:site-specific DNA-methyltransferase [Candidatus Paceibacterota bacterium]
MTSPPYWALRDYGTAPLIWDGDPQCQHEWKGTHAKMHCGRGDCQKGAFYSDQQTIPDRRIEYALCANCGAWKGSLGLEPTPELYIKHLCDIFDQVKRVLVPYGSCWVNLGDCYGGHFGEPNGPKLSQGRNAEYAAAARVKERLSAKSLVQIPARFQIEMGNRGWILRNEIIWHKPNCMPSSAKDRFTIDFEKVFFFTKSRRYYFNTQYEPLAEASWTRKEYGVRSNRYQYRTQGGLYLERMDGRFYNAERGRIKRSVWRVPPRPFSEAHFATYPEELCETPIDAGCPKDVCTECGKAREIIWAKTLGIQQSDRVAYKETKKAGKILAEVNTAPRADQIEKFREAGFTDCGCNAGFRPGVVLDPFFGAGTTGLVALKQDKDFVGIELNPEYVEMAVRRLDPFMPVLLVE